MNSITPFEPLNLPAPPLGSDPFFYGWRDVIRKLPNGEEEWDQIPLTEEDVLHPQEGDHIVNGDEHDWICIYLKSAIYDYLPRERNPVVLSDTGIYWDHPPGKHHSPDLAVIFGPQGKSKWPSFSVVKEGCRPSVIMEIVSPSTRSTDLGKKLTQYWQAKVPYYVILDRETMNSPWKLIGLKRGPRKYQPMELDDQGRLWLEPLNLWLGLKENRLVCFRGDTGEEIKDYTHLRQEKDQEKERANQEKERANQEMIRANREKERANQEMIRANQEKTRADALETRLRELEAALIRETKEGSQP